MGKAMTPNIMTASVSSMLTVPAAMTDAEFKTISSYIEKKVGIKMPEEKKLMIQSRLTSRLKALHMRSFQEYIDYVFSSSNDEITTMIDVLTTNLTHFFREKEHFNVLVQTVLPSLVHAGITTPQLWSAGCSTGEEPYTLSIVMHEYMRKRPGKITDYDILASDISTRVLSKASNAVYPIDTVESLPYDIKKLYFLKSKSHLDTASVRLKPHVREKVHFQRINFMDASYNVQVKDIIFCRNVLIYFEKKTQEEVIKKLLQNLKRGGFLFLGHSETIFGMDLPVETIAPTVFRKI